MVDKVADLHGSDSVSRNETSHNVDFAKGGDTAMFGQQHVGEQKPGGTATNPGGDPKFASGGSNKMFGFAGSENAQAGITSAR